jgi:hypothetical protein
MPAAADLSLRCIDDMKRKAAACRAAAGGLPHSLRSNQPPNALTELLLEASALFSHDSMPSIAAANAWHVGAWSHCMLIAKGVRAQACTVTCTVETQIHVAGRIHTWRTGRKSIL